MPQFDTELIQVMRNALDEVMTSVPSGHSTPAIKVYLAEFILKAAAQGKTRHNDLVAVATDQIGVAISLFASTLDNGSAGSGM